MRIRTKDGVFGALRGYGLLAGCMALNLTAAYGEIRPEKVFVADAKKTQSYVQDGLIVGGDKAIDDVLVKDIRRAMNPGFERIVIDLEGNQNGESVQIQRPPYFQFAVSPDERRLTATLWGHPKLGFASKKVIAAFKRSSVIKNVVLLPRLRRQLLDIRLRPKDQISGRSV